MNIINQITRVVKFTQPFAVEFSSVAVADVVVFEYEELRDKSAKLGQKIQRAYGPHALGVSVVRNVPGFVEARQKTLPLAYKLGNLPKEQLKQLERPEIFHSKGWSLGVEKFFGKTDWSQGSYYANPILDEFPALTPEQEKLISKEAKALRIPNFWPDDVIPGFSLAYQNLGRNIVNTGGLLAYHIDQYVHSKVSTYDPETLHKIITQGSEHVARMLHYYPVNKPISDDDGWCGWHNDHGALTGLTSALFTDQSGNIVEDLKDNESGLYAKNRFADVKKINIPKDAIGFQIGEVMQILSGGFLEATPHMVKIGNQLVGTGISRNTYPVFMEPNWNYKCSVPAGMDGKTVYENQQAYRVPDLKGRWVNGENFGDFSHKTLKAYS